MRPSDTIARDVTRDATDTSLRVIHGQEWPMFVKINSPPCSLVSVGWSCDRALYFISSNYTKLIILVDTKVSMVKFMYVRSNYVDVTIWDSWSFEVCDMDKG